MAPGAEAAIVRPDWPAPPSVRALTTTRQLPGNSRPPFDAFNLGLRSGEDEATVRANRAQLERAFGLPATPCWLRQEHGTGVVDCSGATLDEPHADAAYTSRHARVLAILSADCLPILLCAADASEVGAIHAGWRGLAAGVIEACVARLRAPRSQLLAWLGPAIGADSYEVGAEVRAAFVTRDADAASAFVATRPDHWHCDLYALARRRLAALGIDRVYGGGWDTCRDARFYSYRRERVTGRCASLIWISDAAAPIRAGLPNGTTAASPS